MIPCGQQGGDHGSDGGGDGESGGRSGGAGDDGGGHGGTGVVDVETRVTSRLPELPVATSTRTGRCMPSTRPRRSIVTFSPGVHAALVHS